MLYKRLFVVAKRQRHVYSWTSCLVTIFSGGWSWRIFTLQWPWLFLHASLISGFQALSWTLRFHVSQACFIIAFICQKCCKQYICAATLFCCWLHSKRLSIILTNQKYFLHCTLLSTVQGQAASPNIITSQNLLFWLIHSWESNWYQDKGTAIRRQTCSLVRRERNVRNKCF